MTASKIVLNAASGVGGAGLDVDEVFSTYLYKGNGGTNTITNGINLGDNLTGPYTEIAKPIVANSGVGGYLYRNSDFSGNADGKTFTFSGWAYPTGSNFRVLSSQVNQDSTVRFSVIFSNALFKVQGYNSSGTNIIDTGWRTLALNNWYHFLISVDLSSTSNRYLYINDAEELGPSSSWTTYTNDSIDFTNSHHYVNAYRSSADNGVQAGGGLAQIYLDYTYRDLSVVNNRRTFVTANIAPAGNLSSLNPILYLPFDATNSTGSNLGTGGDFVAYNTSYFEAKETGGPGYDAGGGEGGLVWLKDRSVANASRLYDSERDSINASSFAKPALRTDGNSANLNYQDGVTTFNSNGFVIKDLSGAGGTQGNTNNNDYASWTFRKAPKFFDVVTYTGDGASSRTISHNLDTTVGTLILKRTDNSSSWSVYHRSTGVNQTLLLEDTSAIFGASGRFGSSAPTSTTFDINSIYNVSGATYVAYLFAHNNGDGGFGPDGNADAIKCGSYTGNGSSTGPTVNLGFEPQWLLIKNASASSNWTLFDNMRGLGVPTLNTGYKDLNPNLNNPEAEGRALGVTATGFQIVDNHAEINGNGNTYIYMAIRRPTAVPESATEVFDMSYATDANDASFPVDFMLTKIYGGGNGYVRDRLRFGTKYLLTEVTNADLTGTDIEFDDMTGTGLTGWGTSFIHYNWKRAPKYMDVVAYTGAGANTVINHNLDAIPEMVWVKNRGRAVNWNVYHKDLELNSDPASECRLFLNTTSAVSSGSIFWGTHTDTTFTMTVSNFQTNYLNDTYIAYLFATLAGISKVGSVTHSGTTNVDCGFSAGASLVMLKRTDATGDWYWWDSIRGIVSGNDPYLLLNTTAAEVTNTDYIDPLSSGFTITSNFTAGDYIFYAIA